MERIKIFAIQFVFVFLVSCSTQGVEMQFETFPYENSEFITIDGFKLHYRKWLAEGTDEQNNWVFLLHGFCGSTYSWNKNIDLLTGLGFNVVAVDLPPYGYSDKSRKMNHSEDNRADLLWTLLTQINSEAKWHLVGHSMGGGVVAAMAIVQPDRVEKVVLVAPLLFGRLQPGRSTTQRIVAFQPIEWMLAGLGRMLFIQQKSIEIFVKSAYDRKGTSEEVQAYYTPLKQKGMTRAILSSRSRSNPKKSLCIADLKNETLAIWGNNDRWVPFSKMKPFTDCIENISIVIIKDTGHNPMETEPEIFNRLLEDFLTQ